MFFFDRLSLFALSIADTWAQQGTFVVFEPAGLGRPHLFERAVRVANLIKFSSERAPAFREHLRASPSTLVETLGADGARLLVAGSHDWRHVAANPVENVVDSAGAGDWTTAGLIDELFANVVTAKTQDLAKALAHGQILGAEACAWKGVYPKESAEFDREDFESFACPRVIHENHGSRRELSLA
ncbi:PfkB family carbohydrate kinase [Arthrobacter sp. B6]|uniref:PfkB family carbohydrate kinase n=1 Tax=Arthrobacter sp. B6 TaxID=1570137 RepID=UPI001E3D3032|nr:PfkB family carbohydrate kinase [Arthrobacter sp. B6]